MPFLMGNITVSGDPVKDKELDDRGRSACVSGQSPFFCVQRLDRGDGSGDCGGHGGRGDMLSGVGGSPGDPQTERG